MYIDLYIHRLTQLCIQLFQFIWRGVVFIATYFDLKNHHYVTINKITLMCSIWTGTQNGCKIVNMDYQNCGIVSSFWNLTVGEFEAEKLYMRGEDASIFWFPWHPGLQLCTAERTLKHEICFYFCINFWFDFRVLYLYIEHLLL